MMKASGRAALVALAGLLLLFGATAQAAPSSAATTSASKQADTGKQGRRASRHHSGSKTAQKSDDKSDKADATPQADETKADASKADASKAGKAASADAPASSQMPPEVANANAQLAAADTPPAAAASAMTGRANDNVQAAADNNAAPNAENQVVPPDQLNDLDRALQQDNPSAQKSVIATADAQPRPAPVIASSQPSSAWDQSSLIGKIFIGVGTLLTLASAARMFMA
ncbi:hypothetical protein G8O24_19085 [Bradyrhizobium sp. INPA01-394B]|uniref:Uncharacterized protein n=1 Tax=Bradyrhizobium campsiandrae TaxID=1729892 RepID=A0ABR7U4Q4_9BRAD|nr:hypothetical protein [Bradyrhizobium campsiandrae]MBC9879447.1 hypothetical protein [Bradyrhizobium campsiandrae]MBC9978387.1 hypothetical protein [Bradyrhizobium campsiandrae]